MRDYSIIKKSGEWHDVRVIDSYGKVYQNWYETEQECINWIYYMWENERKPLTNKQEMDMLASAIWGCTKLDQELGLLKGNRDNLD
tara:strand:- start:837 stop:1094 length:258 start_codon:yes stop_codon:yes gene_type:complete